MGRGPPEVRLRWVGPPAFQPHSAAPCIYLPTLETVRCPRGQQTLGAPGEGSTGDEVVSPGARNTVGARAVGLGGASSSCPGGEEFGRAPPDVRPRWWGPPENNLHLEVTPPCNYPPPLRTVRSPRGEQTCALPRGEGSRGGEVVSPGARSTVGEWAVGQGAPSSCPGGEEVGPAPSDVRPRWWGPPESDIGLLMAASWDSPPPRETVRSPRGQRTLGAFPRGEGSGGDEGQGRRGHDWDSEYGRAQ